ncbi:diacylglycerol kinase zeta-like isoform X5 [Scomber scombrus]|uniref:Diacylglycerol kinase zeta-like isoform X5 n=1 Tax=Scomber scombrus TaxID=13677 RepID=A0AAV1PYY6_SCOSC
MMRDSAPQIVERPGLEDVAEEEDVFAAEVSAKSALLHSSCQVQRGNAEMEEGQLSVSQVEAEFAQLTFRKQVSYRRLYLTVDRQETGEREGDMQQRTSARDSNQGRLRM